MRKQPRVLVGRTALVSSILAPVLFIGSTFLAEQMYAGYNPASQTISELAALTAPTHVFMTVMFMCTSLCHIVTAGFSPGIGIPGRLALGLAGVATFMVALFPLPSIEGTSIPHRISAMIGFILLAVWPVLGMRVGGTWPWIVRPWGAVTGTLIMGAACFWFLGVWSNQSLGYVGVVERLGGDLESTWPAIVMITLFVVQRRRSTSSLTS
ncbi:MAG: DUF998 domain-containing protein [Actinobacteria bacterium]|uniref:Unannotated protein n=1 Tax=freshwater metagenome TaxID=449393 RepID=A0A6J7EZC7_9ZZZZ|nr:DUF998 domain-containing protein [Actinomycetota bacterium]